LTKNSKKQDSFGKEKAEKLGNLSTKEENGPQFSYNETFKSQSVLEISEEDDLSESQSVFVQNPTEESSDEEIDETVYDQLRVPIEADDIVELTDVQSSSSFIISSKIKKEQQQQQRQQKLDEEEEQLDIKNPDGILFNILSDSKELNFFSKFVRKQFSVEAQNQILFASEVLSFKQNPNPLTARHIVETFLYKKAPNSFQIPNDKREKLLYNFEEVYYALSSNISPNFFQDIESPVFQECIPMLEKFLDSENYLKMKATGIMLDVKEIE